MKKTSNVEMAIAAALVAALAATAALLFLPSPGATGQLAVLGTDPAIAAAGVTQSSMHYNSVYAHRAGSDMSSGWTQVGGSGNLDLMASGSAQTVATSKVATGAYDAFRFNVDSCRVVYRGQEYAATVASSTITAQSQSNVLVSESSSSAAVVDLRTFVMNTGNESRPQFYFQATGQATAVPSSALASVSLQLGTNNTLSGSWWTDFTAKSSTQVEMTAIVTNNSMVLGLHNTGSADAQVQEVIVTPVSVSAYAASSLPSSYTGSAVFTVSGSGSMQATTSAQSAALLSGGTSITSGNSATLTYDGAVWMDFGLGTNYKVVVPGQQYIVTVIGANTYASALVVAS
jgi:hypothetical protein